jgi:hypothetical protein
MVVTVVVVVVVFITTTVRTSNLAQLLPVGRLIDLMQSLMEHTSPFTSSFTIRGGYYTTNSAHVSNPAHDHTSEDSFCDPTIVTAAKVYNNRQIYRDIKYGPLICHQEANGILKESSYG